MTPLTRELSRLCKELPATAEKVLLCPSRRIGHQWIEAVAFSGQPATNVRPTTVRALALELAGPEMLGKGLQLLSPRGANLVLSKVLASAVAEAGAGKAAGYFTRLLQKEKGESGLSSSALVGSLASCFNDLRLAGVAPEDLERGQYVAPGKGEEVVKLYRAFLGKLGEHGIVDHADALRMAGESPALGQGRAHYLVPDGMDLTSAERAFLDAIPADRRRTLPADKVDLADAVKGKEVELFCAVGEVNEVREAFRRILDRGFSLDQVELLYTRGDPYLPMLYEEACRLFWRDGDGVGEVPFTFEEGIPVRYSRPGRALAGWLAWARGDFPQSVLVRMVQDGLLSVPRAEGVSFPSLSNTLRKLSIGFGRERYLKWIEAELTAVQGRLAQKKETADEEGEVREGEEARLRAALAALGVLQDLVNRLLDVTPPPEAWEKDPDLVISSARRFLEELADASDEIDGFARKRFLEQIDEVARWRGLLGPIPKEELLDWLQSLAREMRVRGMGPQPGCLHVAPIDRGGHSGRPLTFILGLDDSRFPGPSSPDPILLDEERKKVSPDIPLSVGRARKQRDEFAALLGRLRGTVVLSYSGSDLTEDSEMFPSPVLLPVYRETQKKPESSMEDVQKSLGKAAASFAPTDPARALDEGEWWMSRLCGDTTLPDARTALVGRYPWFAGGREAQVQRAREDAIGPFDGVLENPGEELDPSNPAGPVLSPSALETLSACPLRYFLERVLGAKPPDEMLEKERDAWLDAMDFGNLLHEIFAAYVREMLQGGRTPGRDRLEAITREKLASYKDLYPPPTEQAFDDQVKAVFRAVGNFFTEEVTDLSINAPVAAELGVGMSDSTDPDPVMVRLPGGSSVRVRGKIDRVDLVGGKDGGKSLRVTDYKSGSGRGYDTKPSDEDWAGRKMQPFIYRELAKASSVLREQVGGADSVSLFRYYFPASKSHSAPVEWSPDEMDKAGESLARLCRLMARGAFPATTNEKDCAYCDFNGLVCEAVEAQAKRMRRKVGSGDERLEPFRELRAVELKKKKGEADE